MFPKTKKKTITKVSASQNKTNTSAEKLTITEALKNKVFSYIVEDFAEALKSLNAGESIRFGKLGVFKKSQRTVNGYTGYQYSFKAHSLVKK